MEGSGGAAGAGASPKAFGHLYHGGATSPKIGTLGKQLKNLTLGKQLKVEPAANCPQPQPPAPAFGLSPKNPMILRVCVRSHGSWIWICGTGWSGFVPNWGCFSLASNLGTDGVFSGQNSHRVSQELTARTLHLKTNWRPKQES